MQVDYYLCRQIHREPVVRGEYKVILALRNSPRNLNSTLKDRKPGQRGFCGELQTQGTSCVGAAKCVSRKVAGFKKCLCLGNVLGRTIGMSLRAGV